MMKKQFTRFERTTGKLNSIVFSSFIGPWKKRSLGLLSILIGFYIGSSLTVYFFQKTQNRLLVVLLMVFIVEMLIRFRNRYRDKTIPMYLIVIDNLRLGSIYAIVLEAFKLGS
tara:strand:- start:122 stop:460 length:339 start_codon:yes stop_codon:yes gene_type:complete